MNHRRFTPQAIALFSACLFLQTGYAASQHSAIEQQKEKILQLAEQYRGNDSPGPRAELEAEVDTLLAMTEQAPIEERVKRLRRAWEQVYGPTSYGRQLSVSLDPNRIYQVVTEQGYYYNIGYSQFLGGRLTTTGFLRGEYQINNNALTIKFTKNRIALNTIPSEVNLNALVKLVENKNIAAVPIPLSSRAREAGVLSEDYVDSTIRISHGGNLDNPREYLYVLKPITNTK